MLGDKEIYALFGESLAIQAVISHVFYELKSLDPRFATAIAKGFDNAASFVEDLAIQISEGSAPEHLVKAIDIIEKLWAASLGRHNQPRHGI